MWADRKVMTMPRRNRNADPNAMPRIANPTFQAIFFFSQVGRSEMPGKVLMLKLVS